jgi:DHA2 family multidrug resistance protein
MTTTFAAHTDAVTAQSQAIGSMYHTLLSQANLLAYLDNFRLFAGMCLACLLGALLLKNVKPGRPVVAH